MRASKLEIILFVGGFCASSALAGEKPNIVFILADDMGIGDISAYNPGSKIHTPNLDALASRGAQFCDAHSGSSVSTPTRYGILTGRYSWRSTLKSGVLDGYSPALIAESRTTMPTFLKQQGYKTAAIGKWHLGWHWNNIEAGDEAVDYSKPITQGPTAIGFDYFFGISASLDMPPYVYVENDKATAIPNRVIDGNSGITLWRKGPIAPDFKFEEVLSVTTDRAVDYIKANAKSNQPFFLYFPLTAPHTPILPTQEFRDKSGLSPYGDFVLEVDWVVGRVMQALKETGIDENTLIVFASDNGCSPAARIDDMIAKGHYPNYIYRGAKADLYDGGHRIPLIVSWPKKITHHKVDQIVCLTDFFSTFAALTGYKVKNDEGEDSYDISQLLFDPDNKNEIREAVVHHSITGAFSIRKGEWKLLLSPGSGGWSAPRPEDETPDMPNYQLYNMNEDISEKVNLQSANQDKVEALKSLMDKYIQEGRSASGIKQ